MAAEWLDKMLGRVRDAPTLDAARVAVKDYLDPATGERVEGGGNGDDGDTHIHLHMNGKGEQGGGTMDDDPALEANPDNSGGAPNIEDLAAQVAELTQRLAQVEAMVSDEEDVELEDPETQDARTYKMRRGGKMKRTKDQGEDIPVPERREEIIGTTDLPGIEDLDARMPSATADQRRKAFDRAMKTRDSADQEDLWKDTVANAEIIIPGFRMPTYDARLPMMRTAERLCSLRRRIMTDAFKDTETAAIIEDVVGIKTADGIKPLSCDSVKMAFNATAGALRAHNTEGVVRREAAAATRDNNGRTQDGKQSGPPSLSAMNDQNKKFWDRERTNGSSRR